MPDGGMPAGRLLDDLNAPVPLTAPARRVVSLVPSLTEAIAATSPDVLVGATDWCTHPADLDVARVRGTKNPNVAQIVELAPDLVVCNQEENRELDVRRLREAGIAVWVTRIETLDEAFTSMRRLFTEALAQPVPRWLLDSEASWASPPAGARRSVAVPIWRDPWMVVGSRNFTTDLLARAGLDNVFAGHADRYQAVSVAELGAAGPQLVLLPDEPYVFSAADGPEALPGLTCVLVSGRDLTWYGPSLRTARETITEAIGNY